MSRPPLLCVFSLLSGLLSSPLLADDEPLWLRNPAISPDGTAIVFSFQGDLYRVPSGGGLARPLALSDARERRPVFSPDGRWLAFASDRYGNEDVFVMAAEGGPARRLTFYSEFDFPADFTPDGSAVLFVSLRPDAATAEFPSLPHLYQVPREGGRVRQRLSTPTAAARLVDAERVVYHELKPTGFFRKHDTSTAARDLWLVNLRTGESRRLTTFAGEDLYPVPASDGDSIYYVSEQGGSGNVHRLRLSAPGRSEQLTHFKHHPIRDLSAARDGTLCFSFDGGIYTLVPGQEPVRVPIRLADLHPQGIRQLTMTDGATEIAVSPNAREFAFSVRGEVFVTSRSGTTRRLTTTPEEERWLSFRPDGRALLYASERGGRWNLYVAELVNEHESTFFNATEIDEKPILVAAADAYQPQYSSD
ncbi:MAG: peptidase S41, partial [bacterium]|nr:peptidase S41 [bacterium]